MAGLSFLVTGSVMEAMPNGTAVIYISRASGDPFVFSTLTVSIK